MSRLQVGGLALIIKGERGEVNVGKTVTLLGFHGDDLGHKALWKTTNEGLVFNTPNKKSPLSYALIPADRLIPLGDKETQDTFHKEEMEEFI